MTKKITLKFKLILIFLVSSIYIGIGASNESFKVTKIDSLFGNDVIVRYKYISVVDHNVAYIDVLLPKPEKY